MLQSIGSQRVGHDWEIELNWTGLNWTGLNWTMLDWTELDWTGSEQLAYLGEPSGETGGNHSSLWGHRYWQQSFLGTCSTTQTLALASTIVESSLYLIRAKTQPRSSPQAWGFQCWEASDQATNWVGTQPYSGCLKTSWANSCLWTQPCPPESAGPSSSHLWVDTNSRIAWTPDLLSREPTLAPELIVSTREQVLTA